MSVALGTRLGPYEVLEMLGAGGMGEVYRGRDTRLGRHVAIKVLPSGVASDPDRLARFEREARAAAALNHPNICAVFDIGVHDGTSFIVSELLEGETLRQLYTAGPVPVSRAIDYASQIARGLAAAHEKGVIHRDLKPENLFVTSDGRLKILDFGLAKLVENVRADADTALTTPNITEVGQVMGTVGYMSPEQLRGQLIDSRSDIFSLGSVVFEMVAGQRPFHGETPADTASAILREEPQPAIETANVPPVLARIIRRCLEKIPKKRFQSADDLAFALEAVPTASPPTVMAVRDAPDVSRRMFWRVLAACLVLSVAMILVLSSILQPTVDLSGYRFTPFATGAWYEGNPTWSPDGRSIAYQRTIAGYDQILVRSLDSDSPVQLTHESANAVGPFWWPDGSRVGFISGNSVLSVSRAGGKPEVVQKGAIDSAALSPDGNTLAMWLTVTKGAVVTSSVWLASPPGAEPRMYEPGPFEIKGDIDANHVYFSPDGRQLLLVHTTMTSDVEIWLLPIPGGAGSAPRRLSLDAMPRVSGEMPRFSWMPDNRNVIMSIRSAAAPKGGLWLVDTQGGVSTLLSAGLTGQHSPSVSPDGSKIAFALGGYDLDLVEIPTDGSPVRDLLATAGDEHSGTWMPNGAGFVYVTDRNGTQELRAYSKTGQEDRIIAAAHSFGRDTVGIGAPTPSPDGQRIAYYLLDPSGGVGIWVSPFGGGAPVRLTNGPDPEASPEWSPDGQSIAYYRLTAGGAGVLMVREVGTSDPPRELKAPGLSEPIISPPAWSPNGQWIAYAAGTGVHLISPDGERTRLLTPIEHTGLVWSRDSGTLYTSRRMQDGTTQIQGINTATRTVRTINTLPDGFELNVPISPGRRFTLAPDGKSFMASNVHFSSDIWILQNFMPKRALFHGLGW